MIKRNTLLTICTMVLLLLLSACNNSNEKVKIGVSFGVGEAARWPREQMYMEECAKSLGAEIELRLNKTDKPKTQQQDCFELIDSGIDVLIFTPRDVANVHEIIDYAKKHKVKLINYSRIALNEEADLYVGYDSNSIGQSLGQYLSEIVYEGDYIVLRGDERDHNAELLYEGLWNAFLS